MQCPLGCVGGDEQLMVGRDRYHGLPGEFPVVRCLGCGLIRTSPRPSPEVMGRFYPDDYPMYGSVPQRGHRPAPTGLKSLARRLLADPAEALPLDPPGSLLEVGCSSGHFLAEAEGRGWSVEGVEFADSAARTARQAGFTVRTGPLETVEAPSRTFDLVVMRMVLEHLHDPIGGLARLREWTRPKGYLVASFPDAGCYERRWFGSAWYALELPRHLWHFTPETAEKVLERAGWRLRRVIHQRNLTNVVASFGHVLEDRGLFPGLAARLSAFPRTQTWETKALLPLSTTLAALGQTGRMTVWAERTG